MLSPIVLFGKAVCMRSTSLGFCDKRQEDGWRDAPKHCMKLVWLPYFCLYITATFGE